MLPDGSYRMSQTQVAEAAGSQTAQRVRFFTLKRPEKLAELRLHEYAIDPWKIPGSQDKSANCDRKNRNFSIRKFLASQQSN